MFIPPRLSQQPDIISLKITLFFFLAIYCCRHRDILRYSGKVPYILSDVTNFEFSRQIFASLQYQRSRKTLQWQPRRYTRTGRRTDITKLNGAFRDCANVSKKLGPSTSSFTSARHTFTSSLLRSRTQIFRSKNMPCSPNCL